MLSLIFPIFPIFLLIHVGNGHGVMFASKFSPKRIVAIEISPRFVDLLKGITERYYVISSY